MNSLPSNLKVGSIQLLWPLAVYLTSFILAGSVALIINLPFDQSYDQMLSGALVWSDDNKSNDYFSLLLFILAFAYIPKKISQFGDAVRIRDPDLFAEYLQLLLLAGVPFAFYLLNAWSIKASVGFVYLHISAVLVLLVHAPLILMRASLVGVNIDQYRMAVSVSSLPFFFSVFSGYGLYLASIKLPIISAFDFDPSLTKQVAIGYVLISVSAAIFVWWRNMKAYSPTSCRRVVQFSQLGMPLLFLVLIPAPWVFGEEERQVLEPSKVLIILVLTLISLGYLQISSNVIASRRVRLASSLALAALFLFVKMPVLGVPDLSVDDYHYGEVYLPWAQWQDFGAVSYAGFDPARGLNQTITGYLGNLLLINGDNASAVMLARTYIGSFVLVLFVVVACLSFGGLIASMMLLMTPFPEHLILESLILMVLLLDRRLMDRPRLWLFLYFLCSIFIVLYRPQTGPALVIALSIPAIMMSWDAYKSKNVIDIIVPLVAGTLVLLVVNSLLPLWDMVLGVVRYIYHHAEVNTAAHSSMLMESLRSRGSTVAFHFLRFSIVLGMVVAIVKAISIYRKRDEGFRYKVTLLASLIIFLALVLPYIYGRIGIGIHRGPIYSIYFAAILLPMVVYRLYGRNEAIVSLLFAMLVTAALLPNKPLVTNKYLRNAQPHIKINNDKYLSGDDYGISRYGVGYGDLSHLQSIVDTRDIMNLLLQDDETYIDLTNRNALYYYLDRRVPMENSAVYNLPSIAQQEHSVDIIDRLSPKVALVGYERKRFGAGSVSIRAYYLYRYVIENYMPVIIGDDVVVMLSFDLYRTLTSMSPIEISYADRVPRFELIREAGSVRLELVGKDDKSTIELLQKIFSQRILKQLPSSWHHNIDNFIDNDVITEVAKVTSLKGEFGARVPVSRIMRFADRFSSPDNRPDLLSADLSCSEGEFGKEVRVLVESTIDGLTMKDVFRIDVSDDDTIGLLIPLDSAPGWILADSIDNVVLQARGGCSRVIVNELGFYKRSLVTVNNDVAD